MSGEHPISTLKWYKVPKVNSNIDILFRIGYNDDKYQSSNDKIIRKAQNYGEIGINSDL